MSLVSPAFLSGKEAPSSIFFDLVSTSVLGVLEAVWGYPGTALQVPPTLNEDVWYSWEAICKLRPKTEDEVVLKQQMNNIVRSLLMTKCLTHPCNEYR